MFPRSAKGKSSVRSLTEHSLCLVCSGLNIIIIKLNWQKECCMQAHVSGVLDKHTDVCLEELGMLKGTTAKMYVVSDQPRKFVFEPRSVPYALKRKVEEELARLAQTKVIEPVRYSVWATTIVPFLKVDGKVRLWGDYQLAVNRVSHLYPYPIPTLDDLCETLTGGK